MEVIKKRNELTNTHLQIHHAPSWIKGRNPGHRGSVQLSYIYHSQDASRASNASTRLLRNHVLAVGSQHHFWSHKRWFNMSQFCEQGTCNLHWSNKQESNEVSTTTVRELADSATKHTECVASSCCKPHPRIKANFTAPMEKFCVYGHRDASILGGRTEWRFTQAFYTGDIVKKYWDKWHDECYGNMNLLSLSSLWKPQP